MILLIILGIVMLSGLAYGIYKYVTEVMPLIAKIGVGIVKGKEDK